VDKATAGCSPGAAGRSLSVCPKGCGYGRTRFSAFEPVALRFRVAAAFLADAFRSDAVRPVTGPAAQLFHPLLGELDPVVLGGLLYVGERAGSLVVRNPGHLVKPRDGIADMLGIGERLFSFVRKGEHAVGQAGSAR